MFPYLSSKPYSTFHKASKLPNQCIPLQMFKDKDGFNSSKTSQWTYVHSTPVQCFSLNFRLSHNHDWRRPFTARIPFQAACSDNHNDVFSHEFPLPWTIPSRIEESRPQSKELDDPSLLKLTLQISFNKNTTTFNFSSCSVVVCFHNHF